MFITNEKRNLSVAGHTPRLLLPVVAVLLLALLPNTSALLRRFILRDKNNDKISVIMDIEFTMNLVVKKDDKVVSKIELNHYHIDEARLGGMWTGVKNIQFDFVSLKVEGLVLSYTFDLDGSPGNVFMSRALYLTPEKAFWRVYSPLKNLRFEVPDRLSLGDEKKSFLCDKKETVFFKKVSQRSDGYEYLVKMETTYFQVQAFSIKGQGFSSYDPTECKDAPWSAPISKNIAFAIIVGSVVGGIVLMTVVVVVVVTIVRVRRNRDSGAL
ncbi:hypothetical protein ElyMa_004194200 [Elysia marginata]|uniref:Uncharacterized protein n=1 Tax=Elysia marginata TaxID=1093978 RepID=A0AAV4GLT2_9GAST|nr:hypothetical protein ElyMa_004194200 [Elysia marginata]